MNLSFDSDCIDLRESVRHGPFQPSMPWSTPASPKPRAANGFSTLVAASDALEAPLARTRIRAAILGNDTAYREALANMVNAMPDFQCLWQAAESERALTRLHASRPDVLLFDIGKPAQSDTRFLCRLRQKAPRVLVIILASEDTGEHLFRCLEAGVHEYLLRSTRPAQILEAIREVVEGGAPMSPSIARRLIERFHAPPVLLNQLAQLTARERETLDQLSTGHACKGIAERLGMRLSTVRTHLHRIYRKLGMHSRTEAVARYLRLAH